VVGDVTDRLAGAVERLDAASGDRRDGLWNLRRRFTLVDREFAVNHLAGGLFAEVSLLFRQTRHTRCA
jgi:hypothetical protein